MSHIIVFDTETTGLPIWDAPSTGDDQPHIVQIAAAVIDVETREIIQSMNVIIKPDRWEIPQVTTDIHGITTEYALCNGIPEEMAVKMFFELWNKSVRVAHNVAFDNRIIRIAAKRFLTETDVDDWKFEGLNDGCFCTMVESKKLMGFNKHPKLSEAFTYFTGEELFNAHNAWADMNACIDVYWGIKDEIK